MSRRQSFIFNSPSIGDLFDISTPTTAPTTYRVTKLDFQSESPNLVVIFELLNSNDSQKWEMLITPEGNKSLVGISANYEFSDFRPEIKPQSSTPISTFSRRKTIHPVSQPVIQPNIQQVIQPIIQPSPPSSSQPISTFSRRRKPVQSIIQPSPPSSPPPISSVSGRRRRQISVQQPESKLSVDKSTHDQPSLKDDPFSRIPHVRLQLPIINPSSGSSYFKILFQEK